MMHSRRKTMENSQYKYLAILIAKTAVVIGTIAIAGYLIRSYVADTGQQANCLEA